MFGILELTESKKPMRQPAVYQIIDITDERIRAYVSLTESGLRNSVESATGIFIAESPKVIMSALEAGMEPLSLLCEPKHISGDAAAIIEKTDGGFPIYTGSREVLASLTGYTLTRGVLCAMKRPVLPSVDEVVKNASRVAVMDGVCDTTNIGSIFRAAAALGIDAVLLTRGTCDPLNRRAVRVSMGTVFKIPWTWLDGPISSLRRYGFKTAAMALKANSIPLDSKVLASENRLAVILGTEGDGLKNEVIEDADYSVIIPMHNGVDSLNVAAAAAITFWQLSKNPHT